MTSSPTMIVVPTRLVKINMAQVPQLAVRRLGIAFSIAVEGGYSFVELRTLIWIKFRLMTSPRTRGVPGRNCNRRSKRLGSNTRSRGFCANGIAMLTKAGLFVAARDPVGVGKDLVEGVAQEVLHAHS